MTENERTQVHSIVLEEREKLRVTGVSDVQSFDEEQVLLETAKGMLIVRGQGLHVEKLQLDAGETVVGCSGLHRNGRRKRKRFGGFGAV